MKETKYEQEDEVATAFSLMTIFFVLLSIVPIALSF